MNGPPPQLAGVILAGGASTRMGGADKALAVFRGITLLDRAIALLSPQVALLGLSVHAPEAHHAALGLPLVIDGGAPGEDRQGPMAGIRAALAWAQRQDGIEWCVTAPVDCPLLPSHLAALLLGTAQEAGAPAAFLRTPAGEEPLAAIWSAALAGEAERFMKAGGRSARAFHRQIASAALDGDALWSANLNSPADIARQETASSEG